MLNHFDFGTPMLISITHNRDHNEIQYYVIAMYQVTLCSTQKEESTEVTYLFSSTPEEGVCKHDYSNPVAFISPHTLYTQVYQISILKVVPYLQTWCWGMTEASMGFSIK